MLFDDNFTHGDLHPGNILIRARSSTVSKKQSRIGSHSDVLRGNSSLTETAGTPSAEDFELVFLDAGIVVELGPRESDCLVDLFSCIVKGDGPGAGRLMLDRSRQSDCSDEAAFVSAIAKLVEDVTGGPVAAGNPNRGTGLRLSAVQVGALLGDVLSACHTHKVLLEARFASTVSAIAVLEGLGRSLDPDLDILQAAAPVVLRAAARAAKRRLSGGDMGPEK